MGISQEGWVFYYYFTRLFKPNKKTPEGSCSLPARTNIKADHCQSCYTVRGGDGLLCLENAPTGSIQMVELGFC